MDWLLSISHERSLTVAGEWLLKELKPDAIALAYLGYLNGVGLVVNVGGSTDAPIWDALTRLGIRIFGPTDMTVATP